MAQLSACTGGQKLLEAYARVQQLRGMPTAAPATISPALQQTSKASLTDLLLTVPVQLLTSIKPPCSSTLFSNVIWQHNISDQTQVQDVCLLALTESR